jgi:AcrR family transcriptional regulator
MKQPKRAGRGRPVKDTGPDTSAAILDAAEELFALHGFDGVTLRQVATRAGVDVALIGYYFETKRGLFDAVFLRRAEILNQQRLDALDAYEREHGSEMTLEGLMEAFLRPTMEPSTHQGPGWRNYFALVAQVNNTPVWGGEIMTRYFDPVIHRLIALVRRVMPEAADEDRLLELPHALGRADAEPRPDGAAGPAVRRAVPVGGLGGGVRPPGAVRGGGLPGGV